MEQKLVEYFKEKYNPLAIILHGSRARGMSRPQSDWDIFLITDQPRSLAGGAEVVEGQMLDPEFLTLPLSDADIEKHILKLRNAKILHDTDDQGKSLVDRANIKAAEGINLTKEEIENSKYFLMRVLTRLEDSIDDPFLFLYRFWRDFAPRAFKYWYEILNNQYQQPPYVARVEIKEKDPKYYEMIEPLWTSKDNKTKLETARKIFNYIFVK